jgi:glycosyltransferase involved in cell wall biosynthesis
VGGVPEFVENGVSGWLAAPDDPKDFAEKIGFVLSDPVEAHRMGMRARMAVAKKCDPGRVGGATLAMYELLLKAPN